MYPVLDDYQNLSYAFGLPPAYGLFKSKAEDFIVRENLSFELTGDGEHVFLLIEKKNLNTEDIVTRLSKLLGKKKKDIAYAGLKDRQAVTAQWFSVQCPGEEVDLSLLPTEGEWRLLKSRRHQKKLKKGALASNCFTIVLREVSTRDAIEARLKLIQAQGVPNYFGWQRFGYQGQNLNQGLAFLLGSHQAKGKFLQGIYYSAIRSYLFNKYLSARVDNQTWHHALPGDVMQFTDGQSVFAIDLVDEKINERIAAKEISATGVLWGRGEEKLSAEPLAIQSNLLVNYSELLNALEKKGLERQYRALRLIPQELSWQWLDSATLELSFSLRPGAYATSVLRELLRVE
jgi:tRNA pseudouridine13 synthase